MEYIIDKILVLKILKLEKEIDFFPIALKFSLTYIQKDLAENPKILLIKYRKMLEIVLNKAYACIMCKNEGDFRIGHILDDSVFKEKIEQPILTKMNAIRSFCNFAVLPENMVCKKDALVVLEKLCDVLEWYLVNYKNPVKAENVTA